MENHTPLTIKVIDKSKVDFESDNLLGVLNISQEQLDEYQKKTDNLVSKIYKQGVKKDMEDTSFTSIDSINIIIETFSQEHCVMLLNSLLKRQAQDLAYV